MGRVRGFIAIAVVSNSRLSDVSFHFYSVIIGKASLFKQTLQFFCENRTRALFYVFGIKSDVLAETWCLLIRDINAQF